MVSYFWISNVDNVWRGVKQASFFVFRILTGIVGSLIQNLQVHHFFVVYVLQSVFEVLNFLFFCIQLFWEVLNFLFICNFLLFILFFFILFRLEYGKLLVLQIVDISEQWLLFPISFVHHSSNIISNFSQLVLQIGFFFLEVLIVSLNRPKLILHLPIALLKTQFGLLGVLDLFRQLHVLLFEHFDFII